MLNIGVYWKDNCQPSSASSPEGSSPSTRGRRASQAKREAIHRIIEILKH